MAGPRQTSADKAATPAVEIDGARVLVVEARFYDKYADELLAGARAALEAAGAEIEIVTVDGALEIPATIAIALDGAKRREAHEFPLRELLREAGQKSRRFADSYRVTLEMDADSAAEMRGLANREMLLRALSNLIRNAVQHAGESGKVTVRASRAGDELVVSVTDSGVPLSREVGEQAFTAEGQLATKNVSGGRYSRGLGLYAARVAAGVAGATVRCPRADEARFELCVTGR